MTVKKCICGNHYSPSYEVIKTEEGLKWRCFCFVCGLHTKQVDSNTYALKIWNGREIQPKNVIN